MKWLSYAQKKKKNHALKKKMEVDVVRLNY